MQKNRLFYIWIIVLVALALVGCGAGKSAQAPAPVAEKNTVTIQDFKFSPAEITIQKGETITWINQDSAAHTVTGKEINSGSLTKGQSFKQTFNEAGVFDYHCTPHPTMKGKIIVK